MKRWRSALGRVVLADAAAVAVAAIITFAVGPPTRHVFAVSLVIAGIVILAIGTAAIYGGELRGANLRRSRVPSDRTGLPPRDDAETGVDAELQSKPPRLRAMLPAIVAFAVAILVAVTVGLV